MKRLGCVVVGCPGSPFSVAIPKRDDVDGLKENIAIKKRYRFPADEMDVYMATNGAGFSSVAAAKVTLDQLHDARAFKKMEPLLTIKKNFGRTYPKTDEQVYVFVVVPKHAVPAPTRRLFCVVVGRTGSPFSVTVPEDEVVDGLKGNIAIKKKYQFPADEMDLHVATNGAGFTTMDAQAVTPNNVHDLRAFKKMDPLLSIKKTFEGTFAPNEELVYVFVVVPNQALKQHKQDDARPIAISSLSMPAINDLGYLMQPRELPAVVAPPSLCPREFNWIKELPESHRTNMQNYLHYVADMLQPFPNLAVKPKIPQDLNTSVGESQRELTGACDLYVVPHACGDLLGQNNVVVLMELKKSEKLSSGYVAQTAGYLIAAHTLFDKQSYLPTPVGVLTNLRDEWCLFWVDQRGQICMASEDSNHEKLTRETAWHYIRMHCEYVNCILQARWGKGPPVVEESEAPQTFQAFGVSDIVAGHLKPCAPLE
ncbi:hypothetical protein DYB37_012110 [Aphanomyces astaci]|uniref:Crinkler effector protein N-terminal domain-containing protein n=1 Tax=Aphanomyces astaci TaxID=112090 RepID=A0A418E1P2_APHAT|nr:hypothetical protein DYB37_012110 [Aphanomyces astaci]